MSPSTRLYGCSDSTDLGGEPGADRLDEDDWDRPKGRLSWHAATGSVVRGARTAPCPPKSCRSTVWTDEQFAASDGIEQIALGRLPIDHDAVAASIVAKNLYPLHALVVRFNVALSDNANLFLVGASVPDRDRLVFVGPIADRVAVVGNVPPPDIVPIHTISSSVTVEENAVTVHPFEISASILVEVPTSKCRYR